MTFYLTCIQLNEYTRLLTQSKENTRLVAAFAVSLPMVIILRQIVVLGPKPFGDMYTPLLALTICTLLLQVCDVVMVIVD